MRRDEVKWTECEAVRQALLARRALTAAEMQHAGMCEVCSAGVMETEIEAALEEKPEVAVPADFAARVALRARSEKGLRSWVRKDLRKKLPRRYWGRNTAVAVLVVLTAVVTVRDPQWLAATGAMRMTLMLALAGELAGIALWLGLRA
jgi:hypothetical protein